MPVLVVAPSLTSLLPPLPPLPRPVLPPLSRPSLPKFIDGGEQLLSSVSSSCARGRRFKVAAEDVSVSR